jgi:hypothetical protein
VRFSEIALKSASIRNRVKMCVLEKIVFKCRELIGRLLGVHLGFGLGIGKASQAVLENGSQA